MPVAVIRGPQTVENIPQSRRVRDVDGIVSQLDPDIAPLTVILLRAKKRQVSNTKFEWTERGLPPQWDAVNNGGGYASGATSIVVDTASVFFVGDIVNVPRTGEKFRVTAVTTGTNTLTIVRGVGTTAAAALLDNDDLQIVGTAFAEGSGAPTERNAAETYPFNYTEIFKTSVGATGSQEASENYVASDRPTQRAQALIIHRIQLERSLLFGERNNDNSDVNNPIRYAGGILSYLTANVKDYGGIMTEPEFESHLQDVFQHTGGSDTRVLFASGVVISTIDMLAAGRLQIVPSDRVYGLTIQQFKTSHGTAMITRHRLLENSPTPAGVAGGPFGYAGYGLLLDVDKLAACPLRTRDTKLFMDVQLPDADAWKDLYLTEIGWIAKNPELHGIIKNVTG